MLDTHKVHKAASDYSDAGVLSLLVLQQRLEQLSNTKLKRFLLITHHVLTIAVAQIIQIYSNLARHSHTLELSVSRFI